MRLEISKLSSTFASPKKENMIDTVKFNSFKI